MSPLRFRGQSLSHFVVCTRSFSYERAQLEAAAVEEAVKSPAAQDTTSTRGVGGPRISPVTGRALGFRGGVANNHVRNLAEAWRRTGGSGGVEWRQAMEEETKCPITMSRMLDPVGLNPFLRACAPPTHTTWAGGDVRRTFVRACRHYSLAAATPHVAKIQSHAGQQSARDKPRPGSDRAASRRGDGRGG